MIENVLGQLQAAGIMLDRSGERLIVSPRSLVTPEISDLVRRHRDELFALVCRWNEPLNDISRTDLELVRRLKRDVLVAASEAERDQWRRSVQASVEMLAAGVQIGVDALNEDLALWRDLERTAGWPAAPAVSVLQGYVAWQKGSAA